MFTLDHMQVSRSVEDVLQEMLTLLNAAEEEDAQPTRQAAIQSSHARLDALLHSHRHANSVTECLLMDLVCF